MKSQERNQEILSELQDAVVQFDSDLVRQAARRALSARLDALDAITKGLAPGIECVVELYARGEYFLPELSMCVDTFFAGVDILRPHVRREPGGSARGTVVIGTVEGDRHDIGKNVVSLLLEAAGFRVCDLGVDVLPKQFVQESIRVNADLVCLSATLTTGLSTLRQIVDMLRMSNPRVRLIVGGGAVSEQDARRWGVDGYAADALSLWTIVTQIMDAPPIIEEEVTCLQNQLPSRCGAHC
jgi:methylmalonyl-CoA mutase cobalamin-binding domain/chain